jgi:hypothetical protein
VKTIRVRWTETAAYIADINVGDEFDPETADLPNTLAEVENPRFEGLDREVDDVTPVAFDPTAYTLTIYQ